jgi:trimethylamine-N-oxide reductase cytochrome c-type subunit TorC
VALAELEALAEAEGGAADRLIALRSKPLLLDPGASEAGRLLPASAVSVLARNGDLLNVRVEGWQQEGVPRLIYAMAGRRIAIATLGERVGAELERRRSVVDPDTGLTWYEVSLTGWITRGDLVSDRERFWAYAAALFGANCATCHPLPATDRFMANAWASYLDPMRYNAALDPVEYQVLLKFLQFNASDTAPRVVDAGPAPVGAESRAR